MKWEPRIEAAHGNVEAEAQGSGLEAMNGILGLRRQLDGILGLRWRMETSDRGGILTKPRTEAAMRW